jgi:hypothetical protein
VLVVGKIAVQPSEFLFELSFIILPVNFVTKSVKCEVTRMHDAVETDEECGERKVGNNRIKYWYETKNGHNSLQTMQVI